MTQKETLNIRHLAITTTSLLALSPQLADANDAAMGGTGATLAPVKEYRIQMAAEHIVLDSRPASIERRGMDWHITATYTFRNPASEAITLTMGFPEAICDREAGLCDKDTSRTFFGMRTTVDGKRVKMRTQKTPPDTKWGDELGLIHLFDVRFEPTSSVTVVHTYEMHASHMAVGPHGVHYVTRTGSLWNGPIGRATFTFLFPTRPWLLAFPPEYKLSRFTAKGSGRTRHTELTFVQNRWTPTRDLSLSYATAPLDYVDSWCPALGSYEQGHRYDDERVTEEALAGLTELSDEQLRLCRNIPYAHHGYPFKSRRLHSTFYDQSPTFVTKEIQDAARQDASSADGAPPFGSVETWTDTPYVLVGFRPDPAFDRKDLTSGERRFVKAVKAIEEARKASKKNATRTP